MTGSAVLIFTLALIESAYAVVNSNLGPVLQWLWDRSEILSCYVRPM